MKISKNIVIGGVLLLAVLAVLFGRKLSDSQEKVAPDTCCTASAQADSEKVASKEAMPLPRLLDLGADKCVPCRMMTPILDELKKEFAGQLTVDFVDVWKNPDAGKQYGIEMIPTQIFFDANGKELYRHAGFISKEEILKKWNELGVALSPKNN